MRTSNTGRRYLPRSPLPRLRTPYSQGRTRPVIGPSGGRSWWAHFEFTRINIEPIILRKKIEDLRRSREQQDLAPCTSFNRDVSLARVS